MTQYRLKLITGPASICSASAPAAADRRPVREQGRQVHDDAHVANNELVRIAAGTLLHEVRNPLMTILGTTELILDDNGTHGQDVIKKVQMIQRSARRIKSTLEQLSAITEPSVKQTPSGQLIDPRPSESDRSGGPDITGRRE